MKTALLLIAEGFEEIEAVTICDVLRRGQIDVTMAGLDDMIVSGAHDIAIEMDGLLDELAPEVFDAIILPGGMAGTENLLASQKTTELLQSHAKAGKVVSAICAAPWVLGQADLLGDKEATIYPGLEDKIGGTLAPASVVQDGNIITSKGPATAMEFALALLEELAGEATAADVAQGLLYNS